MVMSDQPASDQLASGGPATPATSVSSKRMTPPSPGSVISKRSRLNTRPVVATQAGASPRNISLRDYENEQIIDNKIVSRIDVMWRPYKDDYWNVYLTTEFAPKFDEDYLSTDLHVSEWGKLLSLQEKGVATKCCVIDTVIMRAKQPGERAGDMNEACDRCIRTKRLCARLVQLDGVIKLRFSPLPKKDRGDALWHSLDFWVRP